MSLDASTASEGCAVSYPPSAVPQEGTDNIDLERVERELRAEREELRARLAELAEAPGRGSQGRFGKGVSDGTTEAVGRLTEVGVFEKQTDSERRVERAIEKIEE